MKKNILISLFVFVLFPFSLAYATSAQAADAGQKVPRENGVDEGMLYYWLRYGGIVPNSLVETLQFLGTGFAADPANSEQLVGALAKQWVFGSPPAPGVSNYSTSIVEDMQTAGYFSSDEAAYLQSAGAGSLSFPTTFEPLPDDQKNKTGAEKAKLKNIADFPSLILGGANRAGNDMLLTGMALARAENLSAAVPAPGDMLPEQAGTRDIGKNTGTSYLGDININGNSSVAGASIGSEGSGSSTDPRVLQAATGPGGSNAKPDVFVKALSGKKGQVIKPTSTQNTLANILQWMGTLATISNPDSTGTAVNTGVLPPPIGDSKSQKPVTSTGASGNGSFVGTSNEVAQNGAPPKTNLGDAQRYAERNITDNLNNRNNQIQNQNNYLGNHSNLSQQFPPDILKYLMDNKFPSDGSGSTTPTSTPAPTPPDPAGCKIADAFLPTTEVTDIASLMGLNLDPSKWTISYFKANEFLGTTIYLGSSDSTQNVDSTLVSNPNDCIWVVYAKSLSEGVYVTDARSQTAIKFFFRMP